ncbi:MAG: magnesium/cobalt transporter CorA [Desulfobacterales bacterium]
MPRFARKISRKAGLPPGTLMHIGEQRVEEARLSLFRYDSQDLSESTPVDLETALASPPDGKKAWLNVDGLHEVDIIGAVGSRYGIHPLTQEDILNAGQRPKIEFFDDYVYIVIKMIVFDRTIGKINAEQVSIVFGKDFLVSFQEGAGDVFDPVRERLRSARGKIRGAGPDYLAYTLLDAVIDHYFHAIEAVGDEIETLEADVTENPDAGSLRDIHRLKHEMIFMRKQIWPLRTMLALLRKGESAVIMPASRIYISDIYDHAVQSLEIVESLLDLLAGLQDLYLSQLSIRMNEVMKVLTIIATVFIPMTFIAGVYGMNFKYMPELDLPWAYPAALALMAGIALGFLLYFRRKRWL